MTRYLQTGAPTMDTLTYLLIGAAAWAVLSVPAAVVVGRMLDRTRP